MDGSIRSRVDDGGRLLGRRIAAAVAGFARAAFPLACAACGAPGPDGVVSASGRAGGWPLCGSCDALAPVAGEPFCLACARRGGSPRACTDGRHLRLRAAFVWSPEVRAVVHAYKFGDAPELATGLASRARATPAFARATRVDVVVPVPLHPVRRRERGYDQAARLAEAWSAAAGAPVVHALVRARRTRQQALLSARERATNVAGAFVVTQPAVIAGRRVALVDDVVTTGETMVAAAAALTAAGARVEGWAVAYEPLE
jgi:ComF family protein